MAIVNAMERIGCVVLGVAQDGEQLSIRIDPWSCRKEVHRPIRSGDILAESLTAFGIGPSKFAPRDHGERG